MTWRGVYTLDLRKATKQAPNKLRGVTAPHAPRPRARPSRRRRAHRSRQSADRTATPRRPRGTHDTYTHADARPGAHTRQQLRLIALTRPPKYLEQRSPRSTIHPRSQITTHAYTLLPVAPAPPLPDSMRPIHPPRLPVAISSAPALPNHRCDDSPLVKRRALTRSCLRRRDAPEPTPRRPAPASSGPGRIRVRRRWHRTSRSR